MLQDEDDDNHRVVSPVQQPKKEKANEVSCPICSKKIPAEKIEAHVNVCLDGGDDMDVAPKDISPIKSPVPQPKPKPDQPDGGASYVKAQEEYYKSLQRKRDQEEQDRLLAEKLMGENNVVPVSKPVLKQEKKSILTEDEKLALELQKQEEEEFKKARKAKEEADRKLAEDLERKDKEIQDAQKKKKEWDDAVSLIKMETRLENDEMLAKLLKEKEELLAQLANEKHKDHDSTVSISLDGMKYPKYWCKQTHDFQTFDVYEHSDEYNNVIDHFHKGLPGAKVVRLERNQNKSLWMWYYLRREAVSTNNNGKANEQNLFHGSRNDAYDTILKDGLDHRVANLGGSIGAGIYFATSSGTSSGYVTGSKFGAKKMLYCRVTLGNVGAGKSGLRRPPEIKKGKLYDSVGNPTMYVIFDNYQSYPEYVIHFKDH